MVVVVIAVFGTLLGWGWIALGWTELTTTNNVSLAIETAKHLVSHAQYNLTVGSEDTYSTDVKFQGACLAWQSYIGCPVIAPPVSNSSTTVEDYVAFDLSSPNGTSIGIWYTGPQGNMTFDCGPGIRDTSCQIEPNYPGVTSRPYSYYFLVPTPGNYSIHVLAEKCITPPLPQTYNCNGNTANGSLDIGLSRIQFDRPYWAWGTATEIGAIIGIITTITVAGITAYRGYGHGGTVDPSLRDGSSSQGTEIT